MTNMIKKKIYSYVRNIFLIIYFCIVTGCTNSFSYVASNNTLSKNTVFTVANENDPIGVSTVILEGIANLGYQAQMIHAKSIPQRMEPLPTSALGSGFFISRKGMMITNAHVVKGANSIVIQTVNGEHFEAKVVSVDKKNDIAIMQPIELYRAKKWLPLSFYKQNADLGDDIKIVGYPLSDILGQKPRVTEGIISAEVGLMDDPTRFQFSASIQPGSSGSPVLNSHYKVIGIATEKISDLYAIKKTGSIPQNINFAVKADYARMLLSSDEENIIASSSSKVNSLKDAVTSTVLVNVNSGSFSRKPSVSHVSTPESKNVVITYSYLYNWDVFHYTLSRFNMEWIDKSSGKVVANGNFSGASLQSYVDIVQSVINSVANKAGM